jgi:starvation-inducible DNA-binding protein
MAIDIGISEEDRKSIVEGLSRLLSDTYVLYLKTHNFHWNVTGPMFRTLHLMFEEQYNELALAVDSIAERIRALGFPAPGAYATYARLSSIKEEEGVPSAEDMIKATGCWAGGSDTHRARYSSRCWTRSATSRLPTC